MYVFKNEYINEVYVHFVWNWFHITNTELNILKLYADCFTLSNICSFKSGFDSELIVLNGYVLALFLVLNCFMNVHCLINEVDGAWNFWSAWSTCSVTCGDGQRRRSRICIKPAPTNGGRGCVGGTSDSIGCFNRQCPGTCRT